jgi:hypothetical protein
MFAVTKMRLKLEQQVINVILHQLANAKNTSIARRIKEQETGYKVSE